MLKYLIMQSLKENLELEKLKKIPYKNCIVPNCNNTTIVTPGKEFLRVPENELKRKSWCDSIGICPKKLRLSCYCCEDHFNLKEDLENYMEYKLTGCRKRLKNNVVPRYFENILKNTTCKKDDLFQPKKVNNSFKNDFFYPENMDDSVCKNFEKTPLCIYRNKQDSAIDIYNNDSFIFQKNKNNKCSIESVNKYVQTNISLESKLTQTDYKSVFRHYCFNIFNIKKFIIK